MMALSFLPCVTGAGGESDYSLGKNIHADEQIRGQNIRSPHRTHELEVPVVSQEQEVSLRELESGCREKQPSGHFR